MMKPRAIFIWVMVAATILIFAPLAGAADDAEAGAPESSQPEARGVWVRPIPQTDYSIIGLPFQDNYQDFLALKQNEFRIIRLERDLEFTEEEVSGARVTPDSVPRILAKSSSSAWLTIPGQGVFRLSRRPSGCLLENVLPGVEGDAVAPIDHGLQALILAETGRRKGLFFVDGRPAPAAEPVAVPEGAVIEELYALAESGFALARGRDGGAYLFNRKEKSLKQIEAGIDEIRTDAEVAWMVSHDGNLHLVDGRKGVSLPVPLDHPATYLAVAGDGRHAWAAGGNRLSLVGADLKVSALYGSTLAQGWLLDDGLAAAGDGVHAWALLERQVSNQLLYLDREGPPRVLQLGYQSLCSRLIQAPDSIFAWLKCECSEQDCIYLVSPYGGFVNPKMPGLRGEIVTQFDPPGMWFIPHRDPVGGDSRGAYGGLWYQTFGEKGSRFFQCAALPNQYIVAVWPLEGEKRALAQDEEGRLWSLELNGKSVSIRIRFGDDPLDFSPDNKEPRTIRFDPDRQNISYDLSSLEGDPIQGSAPPVVQLIIAPLDRRGERVVCQGLAVRGTFSKPGKVAEYSKNYRLMLVYNNFWGSDIEVEWPKVRFVPPNPLWLPPAVISLLAVLALNIIFAAATAMNQNQARLLRFIPPLIMFLGLGGSGGLGWFKGYLDVPTLGAAALVSFVGAVLGGYLSPQVFRFTLRAAPFHYVGSMLLALPRVRKRMYADYVAYCYNRISAQRKGRSFSESYLVLPARILALQSGLDHEREWVESREETPAEFICRHLNAQAGTPGGSFLIEAIGGRGKSALLREAMELTLKAFEQNGTGPLPILAPPSFSKLDRKSLSDWMGDHVFSAEIFEQEIRSGNFFLVIDDLRDAGLKAEELVGFNRDWARCVSILAATRPEDWLRTEFISGPNPRLVEPLPLDRDGLGRFISHYREVDVSQKNEAPSEGAEAVLPDDPVFAVCRDRDQGTYSPVLVRWALWLGQSGIHSVGDLYNQAFRSLLKPGQEGDRVLDEAARLCYRTYFQKGERALAYRHATEETRALLRTLFDAGILVAADAGPGTGTDQPMEVRFFHDSMQSYLTAVGMFLHDDWSSFHRAAGLRAFVQAVVEPTGRRQESELFRMCLQVFSPRTKLIACLEQDLRRWSRETVFEQVLSKQDVKLACPPSVRQKLEETDGREKSPAHLLDQAIAFCRQDQEDGDESLARLFSSLAPKMWKIEHPDP